MGAIWKDLFISLTGDTADFEILKSGEVIFRGRARRAPDEEEIKVHVNGACAGYIDSNIEGIEDVLTHTGVTKADMNAYAVFNIRCGDTATGFSFHNDWSYDRKRPDISPQSAPDQFGKADVKGCISDPISFNAAPGQILTYSYINTRRAAVSVKYREENSHQTLTNAISISKDSAATMLWIPDVGYPTVKFNIDQHIYKINKCGNRYAVIYQNSYGGWDSFLLEGNCYRQGKTTTHSYEKAIDNNIETQRAVTNYTNEIDHTWTCNTGWLTDEQSLKLAKHLLPSTNIYLQDIDEQTLTPVNITSSTYKYKTYQNEGRKIVTYQFTLTESNKERRDF